MDKLNIRLTFENLFYLAKYYIKFTLKNLTHLFRTKDTKKQRASLNNGEKRKKRRQEIDEDLNKIKKLNGE